MAIGKVKGKGNDRWTKEVITLYKKIVSDKEVYTKFLAPNSYTSQELIEAFNDRKAIYLPLTKSKEVLK